MLMDEAVTTKFLPSVKPTYADVTPFMMSVAHESFYGAPADFYYFENERLKETMTLINFKHKDNGAVILVRGRMEPSRVRTYFQ